MDLSNVFDTINNDLLITKLEAYRFSNALLFMLSYSKNRSQRVSINISFSTWEEIIASLPQGSTLGPLLVNITLSDIYFGNRAFLSNYADNNALYTSGSILEEVKQNLSQDLLKLSESTLYENCMILNLEKMLLHKHWTRFRK